MIHTCIRHYYLENTPDELFKYNNIVGVEVRSVFPLPESLTLLLTTRYDPYLPYYINDIKIISSIQKIATEEIDYKLSKIPVQIIIPCLRRNINMLLNTHSWLVDNLVILPGSWYVKYCMNSKIKHNIFCDNNCICERKKVAWGSRVKKPKGRNFQNVAMKLSRLQNVVMKSARPHHVSQCVYTPILNLNSHKDFPALGQIQS